MRQDPRTRTTAIVLGAMLLAATAAGAAHADTAGVTGTAFVVDDLTAVLSLDAALDDASATTSVSYDDDGVPTVLARLGTVTVEDKRLLGMTAAWSYSASVPGDIEPVRSKADRTARVGNKPAKSGAQFRVLEEPVGNGTATFTHKDQWQTVNGSGSVPNLVSRSVLGTSTLTTFVPELKIVLPTTTAPGAYQVMVTHSVS